MPMLMKKVMEKASKAELRSPKADGVVIEVEEGDEGFCEEAADLLEKASKAKMYDDYEAAEKYMRSLHDLWHAEMDNSPSDDEDY